MCSSEYMIEAYKENSILLVYDVYSAHDVFKDLTDDVSRKTA